MVKVAFVGAGSMAREHIKAFSAVPGTELAGIFSRTRRRAEELAGAFGIPVVASDIKTLKAETGADLVVVAVPEIAANPVARQCFAEDWAVLLEKPAGYDLRDAEDIAAAARATGRPVMVGFNRRFYAAVRHALADLSTRDEHRYVRVQDQQSFAEARRHNHPEPVVARFMYANSIHVIDLMRALCRGEIAKVTPVMPWRGEETEVVLVHVAFDSGDTALYEGLWRGPGPWACAVSTPSRRWLFKPLERATFQNAGERVQNEVAPDEADTRFKAGFLRQAEAVVARVEGRPSEAVSIADSLQTMRLIHAMFGV